MLQPKVLSMFGALALALFFGAGSSKADVIIFGNMIPGGCTTQANPGFICGGPTETFGPVTATASQAFLTVKPVGAPFNNGFGESGLGSSSSGTMCSDTDCEIGGNNFVTAHSNAGLIEDVVIGSVQSGENFILTGFGAVNVNTDPHCNISAATCTFATGSFTPVADITVTNNSSGDVLLTEVSLVQGQGVPEPASLMLFGSGLLGLGSLLRRQRKRVNNSEV